MTHFHALTDGHHTAGKQTNVDILIRAILVVGTYASLLSGQVISSKHLPPRCIFSRSFYQCSNTNNLTTVSIAGYNPL